MPRTSRSRTNAEWSALTQAALLRAARDAFAERGYERASLEAIAAAAAVTKGSIYHHYRDKRGLFQAVFVDIERQMVERIDQVAKRASSSFKGIQRGCETFLETVLKDGNARIVLTDAPSVLGWARWRAIDNEIGGRSLRSGLEAAIDANEIERFDVDALTTIISGALNEAALAIAESRNPRSTRRAVIRILRRVLEGLRPSSGPRPRPA